MVRKVLLMVSKDASLLNWKVEKVFLIILGLTQMKNWNQAIKKMKVEQLQSS